MSDLFEQVARWTRKIKERFVSHVAEAATMVSATLSSSTAAIPRRRSVSLSQLSDPALTNAQTDCPLFVKLPPEIRSCIFQYALCASGESSKPYTKGSFYSRPGLDSAQVISTSLLLTCRRIYLEASDLLVKENELFYWWNRPPPSMEAGRNPLKDLAQISPHQRRHFKVHVFIQQCNLEMGFRDLMLDPEFRPSRLTLTIRHSDWWFWEYSAGLGLDAKSSGRVTTGRERSVEAPFEESSWGWALCHLEGLKQFVLELETVESKREELDRIVERAQQWIFAMADNTSLVCNPQKTEVSKWEGENKFYEVERQEHGSLEEWPRRAFARNPDKLEYYVVKLTWAPKS